MYSAKETLITKTELEFGKAIRTNLPSSYHLFSQVNLAAFIEKNDHSYRNELFRNVDFLITDSNFSPKIAVEINDKTHLTYNRHMRDEKVQSICEEAGIQFLKLWTSYGINEDYIAKKLS